MAMAQQEDSTVMLSTFAPLSVNSAKHLDAHRDRPFAAAQGDKGALRVTRKGHPMQRRALSAPLPSGIQDLCLRLMLIGPL
ncbi:MAG: hypothetical protein E6I80_26210 [Chloroflexi bacterium]|nr:MAG: hypothetical protein E6I80_26210 [Chloroflexota bacterium]